MIKTIDGAAFSRMMLSAAAEIDLNKQKVNELNVFPVPDGDTGTNMSMTLSAASTEPVSYTHLMAVTRYFLGGNTASGFVSFYGQFCRGPEEFLWVIKMCIRDRRRRWGRGRCRRRISPF